MHFSFISKSYKPTGPATIKLAMSLTVGFFCAFATSVDAQNAPTQPEKAAPTEPEKATPTETAPEKAAPTETEPEKAAPTEETTPGTSPIRPSTPEQTKKTIPGNVNNEHPHDFNAEPDFDDALELLNEDLPISVVSKNKEKSSLAPGIVTSYRATELQNLGYYTLADLADITAGYSSYTLFGERLFETRGQRAGGFDNNKHLLLLDGIPINDARGYKAQADYELPLYFASQVELLKGSASALYGASAFYGAISLQSKSLAEPGKLVEAKLSLGTIDGLQRVKRFMGNGIQRTKDNETKLFLGYYERNASGLSTGFPSWSQLTSNFYRNRDNLKTFFLYFNHTVFTGHFRGVQVGLVYMKKDSGLGESWVGHSNGAGSDFARYSHPENYISFMTTVPFLKYQRELNENVTLYSFVKGNFPL